MKAVALLSGGLDSMLAIRVLQEQDIEVEAVNFQTIFTCCKDTAAQASRELGVRLTVVRQEDDYVELIRKPKYGYGKGANPCVDCRIYMFQLARRFADDVGAPIIASGEVLGQRPMSQKRRDLLTIGRQSGLEDRLLRPLSAKLLPPTRAERDGQIDRSRLYDFTGRSRKGLIELARRFGFRSIPSPSTGCSLTERTFAGKVHDLVQLDPDSRRWDFELLNLGRHLRLDARTKAVVGRRESENEALARMYRSPDSRASMLLSPQDFPGPTVLVVGDSGDAAIAWAAGLVHRFSGESTNLDEAYITVESTSTTHRIAATPNPAAAAAEIL